MGSSAADLTTRLLRNERALVAGAVVLLVGIGWAYVFRGMPMEPMRAPLTAIIAMWWLMMAAMMLPAATPALLLYSRVREARANDAAIAGTWTFLVGYLAVWLAFSVAAALLQAAVTGPSMALQNDGAKGAVLIAAGVYQLSPLKTACLSRCRSSGQFISLHWRPGLGGALRLGMLHGAYCVGCCWMLMALLFVGGVMNVVWVIALTVVVAAEKLLPSGIFIQRLSGVTLLAWGLALILG